MKEWKINEVQYLEGRKMLGSHSFLSSYFLPCFDKRARLFHIMHNRRLTLFSLSFSILFPVPLRFYFLFVSFSLSSNRLTRVLTYTRIVSRHLIIYGHVSDSLIRSSAQSKRTTEATCFPQFDRISFAWKEPSFTFKISSHSFYILFLFHLRFLWNGYVEQFYKFNWPVRVKI